MAVKPARIPPSTPFDWGSWARVLTKLDQARAELKFRPGEECFYRGQPKKTYTLTPSLFREVRKPRQHMELEGDLFFEFRARAVTLYGDGLSDWDVLFYMRHHGCPTRLLDWTESLGAALYFALHDQNGQEISDSPTIWLLNPYTLNEESEWEDRDLVAPRYIWAEVKDGPYDYGDILIEQIGMDWDHVIAIYPEQHSPRVRAQRGWFTLHGDDTAPVEKQCPKACRSVVIPPEAIAPAREFLRLAGIDDFAMFPDLDGLSRTLNTKNSWLIHAAQPKKGRIVRPGARKARSGRRREAGEEE